MADVLIVCVREDEPQAKALAEMFEAAGFSIGGAPSSDGALRSSGAGLVVWSQASIRSRPFLDAAQRVINANKAVVASLIEPPPPSSIGDSPAFDLSRWNGDPNDPSLDPLFFAVDRMVNAARAGVGATAAPEAPAYDPPPQPRRAPPPPAAPQQAPTFTRPGVDPLSSDAEHWRAIRDSRNPSDFMDYLARFGPEGAFAEVAELRLKQLTAASSPTPDVRAPMPRPAAPPASPPRAPMTPRVAMPPTRPPEPRRYDPPPATARRPEPARRPPPERSYDRADLREPPRREGGPLRAFVLVALLGGTALAGGLYFGGGMPDVGGQQEQQIEAPIDTGGDAPLSGEPDSAPDPLSLDEAIDPTPTRPEPPRDDAQRERERERQREQQQQRQREADAASPPVNLAAAGSTPPAGGPVSLSPGSAPPSTVPTPVPLSPALPAATDPAASRPPPAPVRAATVSWAQRPSARRIGELYPARALREGIGGRVELSCNVLANLSVSCTVASESPAGQGFGRAALAASSSYRANAARSDGSSAIGSQARIVVQFQAAAD
ncbi:MAG: energy transducer TonB [Hyphomonadaceae bacterium]|nr:energy transducer TonB [Hyphomonadaceae bacterium]